MNNNKTDLLNGDTYLGIELGSTRIKAVVLNSTLEIICAFDTEWENVLENEIWTYDLDLSVSKLQECYTKLKEKIKKEYNVSVTSYKSIGISGMMHGYIALDKNNRLLSPFRTWRNTNALKAAEVLSEIFQFNIPCRWSIAQLYQSILDREEHVSHIDYLTTLSGYMHLLLTGEKVLGICDASGMFPVDHQSETYEEDFIRKFEHLAKRNGYAINLKTILPEVLKAGYAAGTLTEKGAKLLDPTGELRSGIPFCPPEGDAGTGMVATDSLAVNAGNISVGTSIFSMLILDKKLKNHYRDVDVLLSPNADNVAMIHCNNCSSELNIWVGLFEELLDLFLCDHSKSELFKKLIEHTSFADQDLGKVYSYGFVSAEPIVDIQEQIPSLIRTENSRLNLANLVKSILFGAFAPLKLGMDLLYEKEGIRSSFFMAHGGLLKSQKITGPIMANLFQTDIGVINTSSEGGAYGMALLAAYSDLYGNSDINLDTFLKTMVFQNTDVSLYKPEADQIKIYRNLIAEYSKHLARLR